jgi:regulator of RNase E activity RraA
LQRYDRGEHCLVARALTVETRVGDNLAVRVALARAQPGEVLIVAGGGCVQHALVGDLTRRYAIQRGVTGFVVDGAIRDATAFRGGEHFACFARGISHRGPSKDGPGRIGGSVSIDGQLISTGDVVVADEDGLVSFDASRLDEVTKLIKDLLAAEAAIRAEISSGKAQQSWIDAALAKWSRLQDAECCRRE